MASGPNRTSVSVQPKVKSAGIRSKTTPKSSLNGKTSTRAVSAPGVVKHQKPSDRLNPKTIDPVSITHAKTVLLYRFKVDLKRC